MDLGKAAKIGAVAAGIAFLAERMAPEAFNKLLYLGPEPADNVDNFNFRALGGHVLVGALATMIASKVVAL